MYVWPMATSLTRRSGATFHLRAQDGDRDWVDADKEHARVQVELAGAWVMYRFLPRTIATRKLIVGDAAPSETHIWTGEQTTTVGAEPSDSHTTFMRVDGAGTGFEDGHDRGETAYAASDGFGGFCASGQYGASDGGYGTLGSAAACADYGVQLPALTVEHDAEPEWVASVATNSTRYGDLLGCGAEDESGRVAR